MLVQINQGGFTVIYMYVYVQLKELETSQDSRKLLARGGDVEKAVISREEKEALRTDIQEQEVLLQGYQKVSEAVTATVGVL